MVGTPMRPSAQRARPRALRRTRLAVAWAFAAVGGLATLGVSSQAQASPAVDGTRNLSLGAASRSSSFGTQAALANPSNMPFQPIFAIEPMYQFDVQGRTHGLGLMIADSLNNSRISIGLGYLFMTGTPRISFFDTEETARRDFQLSRFGHEVRLSLAIAIVKQWLAVALTPKYQYSSLRYRDSEGIARNANDKLNAFGLDASVTANLAGFVAVSAGGMNLVGNHRPAYNDERSVRLENLPIEEGSIDHERLTALSDYPIGLFHALSVFPLRSPKFSLNFDGTYDWSTYRFEDHVRLTYGGSGEFVVGPVPIRFGSYWDSRGKGDEDDRVFVAGGIAYYTPAKLGGVGVDVGFGFRQQVAGPQTETIIGLNVGIMLNPDL